MLHLFLWFAQHYVPEVASAVAEPPAPAPIHRSDNMIDRLTPKLKDDCFINGAMFYKYCKSTSVSN